MQALIAFKEILISLAIILVLLALVVYWANKSEKGKNKYPRAYKTPKIKVIKEDVDENSYS